MFIYSFSAKATNSASGKKSHYKIERFFATAEAAEDFMTESNVHILADRFSNVYCEVENFKENTEFEWDSETHEETKRKTVSFDMSSYDDDWNPVYNGHFEVHITQIPVIG